MSSVEGALVGALERARRLGFLGPGPIEAHLEHTEAFEAAIATVAGRLVDLGSGGGVPGLILAVRRPDLDVVLVDAMAKRCAALTEAIAAIGLGNVRVLHGRAELVARGATRGQADAVVARGFGPPAATAECAAPLLRVGGLLVVSEPPERTDRWDAVGLATLGLEEIGIVDTGPAVRVLRQAAACPAAYPRRDGVPAKRPLF